MNRFVQLTQSEMMELEQLLDKKVAISIRVKLPQTCYVKTTVLTIQKGFPMGYQIMVNPSDPYCFSDNRALKKLMHDGILYFSHILLTQDFFIGLSSSYPALYKKLYKRRV